MGLQSFQTGMMVVHEDDMLSSATPHSHTPSWATYFKECVRGSSTGPTLPPQDSLKALMVAGFTETRIAQGEKYASLLCSTQSAAASNDFLLRGM